MTADYGPETDRLRLTEMGLKAPYIQVDGAGTVRDLTGGPDVDLEGTIELDWKRNRRVPPKRLSRARITGSRGAGDWREYPDRARSR